jgi:hypothetical protein
MSHDYVGRSLQPVELRRLQMIDGLDVLWAVGSATGLGEHILPTCSARPLIHRPDQPVEGKLGSNSDEDQSTLPMYRGAREPTARCFHCTRHSSAQYLEMRPDSDMQLAFAMLSIQTVRLPANLPMRSASNPGAAPVVMMTCGRKEKISLVRSATVRSSRKGLERDESVIVTTGRPPDGVTRPAVVDAYCVSKFLNASVHRASSIQCPPPEDTAKRRLRARFTLLRFEQGDCGQSTSAQRSGRDMFRSA